MVVTRRMHGGGPDPLFVLFPDMASSPSGSKTMLRNEARCNEGEAWAGGGCQIGARPRRCSNSSTTRSMMDGLSAAEFAGQITGTRPREAACVGDHRSPASSVEFTGSLGSMLCPVVRSKVSIPPWRLIT